MTIGYMEFQSRLGYALSDALQATIPVIEYLNENPEIAEKLAEVHVTVEPLPDEIVHFTEYDDGGIALCGENLQDAEEADGPVADGSMCAECVVIHQAEDVLSG